MGASVMGPAGPGPWDNSNWFPTGTIIVFKGDASFDIDISATSANKDAAIDLATKAIGRLGHPLDYDGAKAVALAPKPVPKVPPCDLIPRARADAILGTLSTRPSRTTRTQAAPIPSRRPMATSSTPSRSRGGMATSNSTC